MGVSTRTAASPARTIVRGRPTIRHRQCPGHPNTTHSITGAGDAPPVPATSPDTVPHSGTCPTRHRLPVRPGRRRHHPRLPSCSSVPLELQVAPPARPALRATGDRRTAASDPSAPAHVGHQERLPPQPVHAAGRHHDRRRRSTPSSWCPEPGEPRSRVRRLGGPAPARCRKQQSHQQRRRSTAAASTPPDAETSSRSGSHLREGMKGQLVKGVRLVGYLKKLGIGFLVNGWCCQEEGKNGPGASARSRAS